MFAGLILTGCGSAGAGSGSTPGVTPSGPQFNVSVTEKDSAVQMHAGQKLEVVLHANPNMNNWSPPRSSDEAILAPIVNPAGTAVVGVTLAAFQALAPGVAEVTAVGSPRCPSGQACPMYAILYSLKVTIAA